MTWALFFEAIGAFSCASVIVMGTALVIVCLAQIDRNDGLDIFTVPKRLDGEGDAAFCNRYADWLLKVSPPHNERARVVAQALKAHFAQRIEDFHR